MKKMNLKVYLYYGRKISAETKYTSDIDQARRWVAHAEGGNITNEQNIKIK